MNQLRALMPALKNKYYFNYGGQGPLPLPALNAITDSWATIQELGPFTNEVWPYIAKELAYTKELLAQECGVGIKRIALTENVTSGCILPILGLPFSAGERILISDCEHPGVVSACLTLASRSNLKVDILPIKDLRLGVSNQRETEASVLRQLEKNLHSSTRLVVVSHILWNTGQVMPISVISKLLQGHPNRPFLLVDAAQSFGQIPLGDTPNQADIYAFTGHKWALGPEGLGGVILSTRILKESQPTLIGWKSLKSENLTLKDAPNNLHVDARQFEIATSCTPLLAGLRSSIKLLNAQCSAIERARRIQMLSSYLWDELQNIKGVQTILKESPPSGLISFKVSEKISAVEIVKALGKKKIWLRSLESPDCLRACCHITTSEEDIRILINELNIILNS